MRIFVLAFAFALLAAGASHAQGDRIWTALVKASHETPALPPPRSLERVAPTLEKIFGYNSFELLGQKKKDLAAGGEQWLVPTKEFFFRVRCLSRDETSYRMSIELYREKDLLVTTEVQLARDAPLYIRGPQWGRSQLIFILQVQ